MKSHAFIYKLVVLVVFSMLAGACYDDKGNYKYLTEQDIMPVVIGDIEEIDIILYQPLHIVPEVTGMEEASKYNIAWYMTTDKTTDTLSYGLTLDIRSVEFPVGNYPLYLSIENKDNGVKAIKRTMLNVVTYYSGGWFVLKEVDGMTDLDFIKPDGSMRANMLEPTGRLRGSPVKMVYQANSYGHTYYPPGEQPVPATNIPVYHIFSENDACTYLSSDFELVKNTDQFFYNTPDVISIQNFCVCSQANHMINDGKLYGHYTLHTDYIGKMPDYKPLTYNGVTSEDYHMSGFLIENNTAIGFETTTRSFVSSAPYATSAVTIPNPKEDNAHPSMNLDYDMVNWVYTGGSDFAALAIMKHIATDDHVAFAVRGNANDPVLRIIPVPSASGLLGAAVIGADNSNMNIYYSAGDNILWNHFLADDAIQRETVFHTFPAGEQVTHINFDKDSNSFNILTTAGENWKIYCFRRIADTPAIEEQPYRVLQGEGRGRRLFVSFIPTP